MWLLIPLFIILLAISMALTMWPKRAADKRELRTGIRVVGGRAKVTNSSITGMDVGIDITDSELQLEDTDIR